jgi:hypothetical protein
MGDRLDDSDPPDTASVTVARMASPEYLRSLFDRCYFSRRIGDAQMSIEAFLNDPAGLAFKGLLVAAFLDFATGSYAALKDGTFALDALAAWVRKHLLGRVAPIATLLVITYISGDTITLAAAVAAGAAYTAETLASIVGNLNPPKAGDVQVDEVAVEVNPVPQD